LPQPVWLFSFAGDYLLPRAGEVLITALLNGQSVVLLCRDDTKLGRSLVEKWPAAAKANGSYSANLERNLFLHFDSSKHKRGCIVVVQAGGTMPATLTGSHLRILADDDIADLSSADLAAEIESLPARDRVTEPAVTIKDLCLLHLRDGPSAPVLPPPSSLADIARRADPLSWTDLHAILRQFGPSAEEEVTSLQLTGRLDPEKGAFYLAAIDFLDTYRASAVRANIYDVVWFHDFLEHDGRLFRGQADQNWRLDTSLFRVKADGSPLDLATLYERTHSTQEFLSEMGCRQLELFGRELPESELLAIAQHYGFPTPLLDFSRSLRVAAFFATYDARKLKPGDTQTGVIYHLKPAEKEFRLRDGARLEESIRLGDFRLLQEAAVRIGEFQYIEPKLKGDDDRIGRQAGLFIDGFYPRDLREIAFDRITFQQVPGEAFEDPAAGVTAAQLLPEHSRLHQLAVTVRERLKREVANHTLLPQLGKTIVLSAGLIGSAGAELRAQIDEAQEFFDDLQQRLPADAQSKLRPEIEQIFSEFFTQIRLRADVGLPSGSANAPLQAAITSLERIAGIADGKLWDVVASLAPEEWLPASATPPLARAPANSKERVVLACALYLVSWSHLCTVNGWRARALSYKAREVLAAYRDTGVPGLGSEGT